MTINILTLIILACKDYHEPGMTERYGRNICRQRVVNCFNKKDKQVFRLDPKRKSNATLVSECLTENL